MRTISDAEKLKWNNCIKLPACPRDHTRVSRPRARPHRGTLLFIARQTNADQNNTGPIRRSVIN